MIGAMAGNMKPAEKPSTIRAQASAVALWPIQGISVMGRAAHKVPAIMETMTPNLSHTAPPTSTRTTQAAKRKVVITRLEAVPRSRFKLAATCGSTGAMERFTTCKVM